MQYYSADLLKKLGMRLYCTLGSPNEEAEILINNLVESSLMGIDLQKSPSQPHLHAVLAPPCRSFSPTFTH